MMVDTNERLLAAVSGGFSYRDDGAPRFGAGTGGNRNGHWGGAGGFRGGQRQNRGWGGRGGGRGWQGRGGKGKGGKGGKGGRGRGRW